MVEPNREKNTEKERKEVEEGKGTLEKVIAMVLHEEENFAECNANAISNISTI